MCDNRNLLEETKEIFKENNKSFLDVEWIGSQDGKYICSVEEFIKLADFDYYPGYGSANVIEDLVIVGKDWWLSRGEYDGSEWWEFKSKPTKQHQITQITNLFISAYKADYTIENQADKVEK